jgi:CheY-like chemotaxis protein
MSFAPLTLIGTLPRQRADLSQGGAGYASPALGNLGRSGWRVGDATGREAAVVKSSEAAPSPTDARPRRILVVEDNPDGRETLCTLLELLGHQVVAATNGVEGVEKALAWHPEVALVDIGLPILDGYDVAQRLRAALGREIVLVACTAYGRPEDVRRARAAGFDGHLVKPLDLDALVRWLLVSA